MVVSEEGERNSCYKKKKSKIGQISPKFFTVLTVSPTDTHKRRTKYTRNAIMAGYQAEVFFPVVEVTQDTPEIELPDGTRNIALELFWECRDNETQADLDIGLMLFNNKVGSGGGRGHYSHRIGTSFIFLKSFEDNSASFASATIQEFFKFLTDPPPIHTFPCPELLLLLAGFRQGIKLEEITFSNPTDEMKSIQHLGDALGGGDDGDFETIVCDLKKVNRRVYAIVLVATVGITRRLHIF